MPNIYISFYLKKYTKYELLLKKKEIKKRRRRSEREPNIKITRIPLDREASLMVAISFLIIYSKETVSGEQRHR